MFKMAGVNGSTSTPKRPFLSLSALSPIEDLFLHETLGETEEKHWTDNWMVYVDGKKKIRRIAEVASVYQGYIFGRVFKMFNIQGYASCVACSRSFKFLIEEGKCVNSATDHDCKVDLINLSEVPAHGRGTSMDKVTARKATSEDFLAVKWETKRNTTLSATMDSEMDYTGRAVASQDILDMEERVILAEVSLAKLKLALFMAKKNYISSVKGGMSSS